MAKLSVNQLAGQLAERTGCDETLAILFIKKLFSETEQQIKDNGVCKIPGLGSFEKADSSENPLKFIAAPEITSALNEAFASFEKVEIPSDLNESELSASTETLDKAEYVEVPDDSPEESVSEADQEPPHIDDKVSNLEEPVIQLPPPLPDEPIEDEIADTNHTATEIPEIKTDEPADDQDHPSAMPHTDLNDDEYVMVHETPSRFIPGLLLGLGLGVILGGLALLFYIVMFMNVSIETIFTP